MPVVPLLLDALGTRHSVALLVIVFFSADIFAVIFYKRSADFKILLKLLPWTLVGVAVAVFTGKFFPDTVFRYTVGVIMLICTCILAYNEVKQDIKVPSSRLFTDITGFAGGFASMIGNVAGPIMNFYFLSLRLPKAGFIGTVSWFFFVVNGIKIPLHYFMWKSFTLTNALTVIVLIPALIVGFVLGLGVVKKIPEKGFRVFIIAVTFISIIKIFI
jgi:uncharacterized membrane protein YfcA